MIVVEGEDDDGVNCSFCFVATVPRSGSHFFFVVTGLPVLFWKLIDVFPGLRSIILHGINFDFNSIVIQMIRDP